MVPPSCHILEMNGSAIGSRDTVKEPGYGGKAFCRMVITGISLVLGCLLPHLLLRGIGRILRAMAETISVSVTSRDCETRLVPAFILYAIGPLSILRTEHFNGFPIVQEDE